MTTRTIVLSVGESYHLYNRGVDKRKIYLDEYDYKRFIELMYLCNSSAAINVRDIHRDHVSAFEFEKGDSLIAIGAYCLMPNHFHILAKPIIEGGVTKFMNKLCTSYVMYFNKKYERTGALFQGKFKSEHADTDEYLKYLYSYIHLNPVKLIDSKWKEEGIKDAAKSFDFAASFQYSSLPDYLGQKREEKKIIDPGPFPEYFLTTDDIKRNLFEWLTYNEIINKEPAKGHPR
jgi:putative transposase